MDKKMKYAIISDIHGNLPALKAVLEDAKNQNITHYLFAGDYCLSGPWPNECTQMIRAIPDKYVIRGNEEKYLEDLVGKDQSKWTDGQMQISYWNYKNIKEENRDYLLKLPHQVDFECNGIPIHMAHSSVAFVGPYPFSKWNSTLVAQRNMEPGIDPKKILADIYDEWDCDSEFQKCVSKLEKGIYIFGHAHVQWSYKVKDKEVYLVNPGSCGLPLDGIKDSIPYTILEITDEGHVNIEEKRLPFDKASYINFIKQTTQYKEAKVWTEVIIKELSTACEQLYFFLSSVEQYAKKIGDDRRPYALDTWEKAFEKWSDKEIHNLQI